jgi:hypothetical protein
MTLTLDSFGLNVKQGISAAESADLRAPADSFLFSSNISHFTCRTGPIPGTFFPLHAARPPIIIIGSSRKQHWAGPNFVHQDRTDSTFFTAKEPLRLPNL